MTWAGFASTGRSGSATVADGVPITDSNTLSDTASYNLPPTDPTAILARTGRTMGQCVLDVLSIPTNAAALAAVGVGQYTSTGTGGAGAAVLGGTRGWQVTSITVASPGSGYTVAPTVVICGPCTTQAVYTATVSGGAITAFVQVNAGAGYLTPPGVIVSTLPAATITDLAALTVIPPFPVRFAGERIIQSIESGVQTCHPNHSVYVTGDNAGSDVIGTIRFLDQRLFSNNTVTLGGSDRRWLLPSLHRDTSDCYSQLIVRGGLQTGSTTLALKQWPGSSYTYNWPPSGGTVACGGLVEDFAWGSYTTNAAAKAAWSPGAYAQLSLQTGQDQGSCTCPSTTTVVITSQNTALTLAANQLDQTNTGQHAVVTVIADVITGVQQLFSARVIASTAMTAGGTSTLTLDQALPALTYNSYRMYALSYAGNVVWRRYLVTNRAIAAAMQQRLPLPVRVPQLERDGRGPDDGADVQRALERQRIAPVQPVDDRLRHRPGGGHDHDRLAHQPGLRRRGRHAPERRAGVRADCHGVAPDDLPDVRLRGHALLGRGHPADEDRHVQGLDRLLAHGPDAAVRCESFSAASATSSSRGPSATWAWRRRTWRPARRSRSPGTDTRPATSRSRTTGAITASRSRVSRSSSTPGPGARPTSRRCT